MIEDYFKTAGIHCQGLCDLAVDFHNNLYTVGSDDLIYCKDIVTKVESRIDLRVEVGSYTTLAAHPNERNVLAIGGLNKEVEIIKFNDHSKPVPVFKTLGPIRSVTFSKTGRYLAIASEEPTAVLYDYDKKMFVKCRPGHSGSVCSVFFSPDERYICSTGTDGVLKVFRIQADPECSLCASYQVASSISMNKQQNLLGCFNLKSTMVAMPGKSALQQVNIEPAKMYLTLNSSIKHSADIAICHWHSSEILITASVDKELSLWKYHNGEKIASVSGLLPMRIVTQQDRFYCIDMTGTLYEYYKISLIKSENEELEAMQNKNTQEIEDIENIEPNDPQNHSEKYEQEEQEEQYVEIKKPSKSKAEKIVTCLPQGPISRSTTFFANNRFLFCSEFGGVIQRLQGESQAIQLETQPLASVQPKKRNLFINRELKYFAISENVIAYGDQTTFGVIGEDSWQTKLEGVVGIAAGNEWVAVATDSSIKIQDFGGNQLRDIAIDKKLVALSGYENLLAYVYHEAIPMYGCQSLRMHVFQVDCVGQHDLICSTSVPVKLMSVLKTFGFSYEGMLYSEDSKGIIRVYNFIKAQWATVYDPVTDQSETKYWLIGIKNYQLQMFKLQQDDIEPTVAPRSQRVALPLEIQTVNRSTFYENPITHKTYGQCMWKHHVLEHQRFRHQMWYKYTISRDKTNPLYGMSSKIQSIQELKKSQMGSETDFLFLIRNMIANNEAEKAYVTVKTFTRCAKTVEKLVQFFEEVGMREIAIKIETHFEEKTKQLEYEAMQQHRLDELQKEIHRNLSVKPLNPMQRAVNPMSQTSSSISRSLNTQSSQLNGQVKVAPATDLFRVQQEKSQGIAVNPFMKTTLGAGDRVNKQFQSRMEKNLSTKYVKPTDKKN